MSEKVEEKPPSSKKSYGIGKIPFDLNNLMSIQFDNLKGAIEYLAR